MGALDGFNRLFAVPDRFVHVPGQETIEVWDRGRRLLQASVPDPRVGEYVVEEAVLGAGFDVVRFVAYTPTVRAVLVANYLVSPS